MIDTILAVRNLSVAYGRVEALRHIDLTVKEGQIVTVIGPNGAGKTTLLAALMGLLPHAGGEVEFARASCRGCDVEEMVGRGMTLVPEKRELFASMSVDDNLVLGGYLRYRQGDRDQAKRLEEIFAIFPRLFERRGQAAGTLSGGERQMLAVARALMAKPRLLMLDEPSLGLAPLIVKEIFRVVGDLRRAGTAILLVEQNARAALQVADYGYVLETGEMALSGPAAELASDPRVVDTYLGFGRRG